MAATAYAALVSLLNTLDQIQIHPLLSTCFSNYPNESLHKKIDFLVDFVENYSDADSCRETKDLLRQIAFLAHEAEDIIEVRAADLILPAEEDPQADDLTKLRKLKQMMAHRVRAATSTQQSQNFWPNLQRVIDRMDFIKEQIIKIKEKTGNRQPTSSMPPASSSSAPLATAINQQLTSSPSSAKTTNMVGFDGYLDQLLDQLTGHHSGRQILPVVGMGGIGKTTLARNVYDNLLIMGHFHVRAWVTVSQEFSVSDVSLQALACLGGSTSKTDRTDAELGEELHKILYGRRYLIVLDDVWSVEDWDKMKFFFPENNNGSRIVITTRQSELVGYFGSSALAVDFLDDKNSWDLFCHKAFGQEDCPLDLVQIGKQIVKKCRGLPLTIVVIAGFLGKSPRTLEYWDKVAYDKSLVLDSREGNEPLSILNFSYKHLPVWLKTCFLYLGLFPEDYPIKVSKLIKLWVAEGFVKSNTDQSLEGVAEKYLKELVDRNLVLVGDLRLNKKFKTCVVHDLVRDLCIRIAKEENFYRVQRSIDGKLHFRVNQTMTRFSMDKDRFSSTQDRPSLVNPKRFNAKRPERHFRVDKKMPRFSFGSTYNRPSLVNPLIFHAQRPDMFNIRLLRVLFWDKVNPKLDLRRRSADPLREVTFRLLIHASSSSNMFVISPSVSRLWSLQAIILTGYKSFTAPCEIWEMPLLRHINITSSVRLPHPPRSDDVFVLQNLQTLAMVEDLILSEEVCKRIPNIKKLGIIYYANAQGEEANSNTYHLPNVECFGKLETLQCSGNRYEDVSYLFRNLKFPSSLKKLSLERSKLVWSDMTRISSLPHLQTLKLLRGAVVGAEWNCIEQEQEFRCLKHLEIHYARLSNWSADESNFPVLETLCLESLSELKEIPSGIGDVPTLQKVKMHTCSKSAALSAVKIVEEQESLGNFGLRLKIMFKYKSDAEKLWEKIEEMDITRENLLIYGSALYAGLRMRKLYLVEREESVAKEMTEWNYYGGYKDPCDPNCFWANPTHESQPPYFTRPSQVNYYGGYEDVCDPNVFWGNNTYESQQHHCVLAQLQEMNNTIE